MSIAGEQVASDDVAFRLLVDGSAACRRSGREDLVELLEVAAERLRRPTTVVCVVGEYKQGKSQLVNALIERDACPVDDDVATAAITVVEHGDEPRAHVRRTIEGTATIEPVPFDQVATVATGGENDEAISEPTELVELVELSLPSSFLERGVAIVDTPGVNALESDTSTAVLDFLPWADGLVLVTDASAELSPPELRFLAEAHQWCPTVIVALTKIDLYPEWRRIADLDRGHLAELGLDAAVIPVSARLERLAQDTGDQALSSEANFADLLNVVETAVLGGARNRAAGRALADLSRVVSELRTVESARLAALESPAELDARIADVRRAREVVSGLEAPDAYWAVLLDERFTALRTALEYQLHHGLKREDERVDQLLSEATPSDVLDDVFVHLRSAVTAVGHDAFVAADDGLREIAGEVSATIARDAPAPIVEHTSGLDLDDLWSAVEPDLRTKGPSLLGSGLGVLLSGASMTGMLATFFSVALGPISLGAAALYGAHQFVSGRSSVKERQREEARSMVRNLLDRAEVELSRRVVEDLHDARQALRTFFAGRIAELSATYASAAKAMEEARAQDEVERTKSAQTSRRRLEQLDDFASRVAAEASFTT